MLAPKDDMDSKCLTKFGILSFKHTQMCSIFKKQSLHLLSYYFEKLQVTLFSFKVKVI